MNRISRLSFALACCRHPSTSAPFRHYIHLKSNRCYSSSTNDTIESVISSAPETLAKVVTTKDDADEKKTFTRASVERFFRENFIPYEISERSGLLRVDCPTCGSSQKAYVSPQHGQTNCVACNEIEPFVKWQKRVTSTKKTESTGGPDEDGGGAAGTERTKQLEDTLKRMESEELDSDLYDRVSYLNLMSQYRNQQSRHGRAARFRDDSEAPSPRSAAEEAASLPPPLPDPNIKALWSESVDIGDLIGMEQNEVTHLRRALGIEKISIETLARYNVRGHMDGYDQPAILYPRYRGAASRIRVPSGLKVIRRVGERMEKENYPLNDAARPYFSGIFGYHMAIPSDRAVVLTTNERDALAVYEATDGALAFALPLGEKLDPTVLPYLEDFDQIFLWFPMRHVDYAREWGYALSGSRCYLVKAEERPIELVRADRHREVKIILNREPVRLRDRGFRSMTDIREQVKNELVHSSERMHGIAQWKRFSALNRYMIGFREGEVTVLTGGTGFGKTTFLCEYALDLFTQGVRTLFCSFEMPEEKILQWMLIQFAGLPLHKVEYTSSIDTWLDKFERTKGPLTVLRTDEFRNKRIDEIVKAIASEIANSGAQHVVIDNLQFLVNQSTVDEGRSTFDRFHEQDKFIGRIRQLASDYRCHITMVVHPRKTQPRDNLEIQDFGGTGRVTQEADNVLAIQRRKDSITGKHHNYLHILKNRYGGRRVDDDILELVFQKATYSNVLIDHSRK